MLRCAELQGGALHIGKALLTLCFWTLRTTTIEIASQDNAGVTPRGVVYTLRSVLRGLIMFSPAHFTGVYIPQRGCLLCLFSCKAVEGREVKQAEVKHPRFSFVVSRKLYSFALDACGLI